MEEKYNFASQQNFYMHLYKVKIVGNHSLLENCKSKPQWGIISHWSEWLPSKSLQTINAVEGVGKGNPLTLLVGMQTGTATMEKSVEIP